MSIHEDSPQAELDARRWLKAAIHFEGPFGGAGDIDSSDPDYDRRIYLEAVLGAQLRGERPVSTPDEMFPYLVKLATWLFYGAVGAGPAPDEELERETQVIEHVLPGPPERREVTSCLEGLSVEAWDVGDEWFDWVPLEERTS